MAQIKSGRKMERVPAYQLKIVLAGIEPSVWRRLLVRGDMNLGLLHAAIQVTMGWTNSHLHHFVIGDVRYTDPTMDEDRTIDEPLTGNERATTLMQVVPKENAEFLYEYDFGDSWAHVITVEKIHAPGTVLKGFADCPEGRRACPPEDCGGVAGYADLLETIKDPGHEGYEFIMEWLGGGFDPEAFDIKKANKYLRKLKWPHTTEGQLARVLMARDGVA